MSGYIGDISCIRRGRHDISWRKIGGEIFPQISPKYRRYIGLGRYIGDFLKKSPLVAKYHRYIRDKSLIFWRYFPSFMQRDLTVQSTPVLIRQPRCDSNGNMAIQRPDCSQFFIQRQKLIFNDKLMFQRLFWLKFHQFLLSFFICSLIIPIFIKVAQLFNHFKVYLF